jgi:hypothetical protein
VDFVEGPFVLRVCLVDAELVERIVSRNYREAIDLGLFRDFVIVQPLLRGCARDGCESENRAKQPYDQLMQFYVTLPLPLFNQ